MVTDNTRSPHLPSHFVIFGGYIRDISIVCESYGVVTRIYLPKNGSLIVNLKCTQQGEPADPGES